MRRNFFTNFFNAPYDAAAGTDTLTRAKAVKHFINLFLSGSAAAVTPYHHKNKTNYQEHQNQH